MSEDKKYNGWTNYETWNVALWLDNEQGSYDYWRETAQEAWNETDVDSDHREQDACIALADRLKDEHNENMPELTGTYADLLGAALSEVNWYEIAEHYISDVEKEEPEEAEADA